MLTYKKRYQLMGIGFLAIILSLSFLSIAGLLKLQAGEKINNAAAEGELEDAILASFPLRFPFIEANGLFRRLLGAREMNGVVRLQNGFLSPLEEEVPEEIVSGEAGRVVMLAQALKERDIPFLYVSPAERINAEADLPSGYVSFENKNNRL
ncbi:MAG: hypothetical protein IJU50_06855, partial [Lachnospiraceae bacterium]|nr:hypothetical protein [Lachnospiraceae bacterium]